jgi:hypothetical protein
MPYHDDYSYRIPADINYSDKIVFGLAARQVAILAGAGALLWVAFIATRAVVPLPVFAIVACPFGALSAVIALGRRDGLPLDRLLVAALRQSQAPRRMVIAPEGVAAPPEWVDADTDVLPAPLRFPAHAISPDGVVALSGDGAALMCAASTVSFALRTPQEQSALIGGFARWLNSLSSPAQVVIRAEEVDLTPLICGLRERAPILPHPALERAAQEHADFLAHLAGSRDLLRRRVLLVLREPPARNQRTPHPATVDRLQRRAHEAAQALAAAGVTIRPLPGGPAAAALADSCDPWQPASVHRQGTPADPDEPIRLRGPSS